MAATVQGSIEQIKGLTGPLPVQLWKTTVTIATGATTASIKTSNQASGTVVGVWIDPTTLTASATIKGYMVVDGLTTPTYFLNYTVPNPAIETRAALSARLRVFGQLQIDVASATAADSFTVYVWVDPEADTVSGTAGNPSADVLSVQGDADGTPLPVSEPDTAAASAGEAVDISVADHTCSTTTRALYVGGGGDVIATVGGVDLTFKDVPGGTILPIAATVIKDESTATDMVALW